METFYAFDPTAPPPPARAHGPVCTEECRQQSRPCHLARWRRKPPAPEVACPHCGAVAGSPCRVMSRDRRRLAHAREECHPSRLEAAA